jgi:hypothetical protein
MRIDEVDVKALLKWDILIGKVIFKIRYLKKGTYFLPNIQHVYKSPDVNQI